MVDPMQMLSQSASQTANLFQAIDRNTQQMFANKFNVQQAQTSLAINTIQQMEQSRINDARIAALNVEMRQREQDIVMQQRAMDLEARLAPLKEQEERRRLQTNIQLNAAKVINPQFDDLKPEIANVIFDSPEIADEIQQEYTKTLNRLGQESTDPNVDIVSRVNEEKKRLRDVVEKKKRESQRIKGMSKSPFGNWLLDKMNVEAPKDYDIGRAASIYESFGGNRDKFNLKNDKNTRDKMDTALRTAQVTGKIDEAVLSMYPVETQEKIIKIMYNKQKQRELDERATNLRASISTLNKMIEGGDDSESTKQQIEYFQKQLSSAVIQSIQLDPVDDAPDENNNEVRGGAQAEQDLQRTLSGYQQSGNLPDVENTNNARFNRTQATKFEKKLEPILRKILPQGEGEIVLDKNRILEGQQQLDASMIEKYVSSVKDNKIDTLVRQEWFKNHLKEAGLLTNRKPAPSGRGVGIVPNQSELANAINVIENSDADIADRKEAINYLKSRLTGILLDYANQ
jgi:hypothetical protein